MAANRPVKNSMTVPVFVDTNVFVYARQASEYARQPVAMQWLERLWGEQTGRTSIQVLNEYYVTLTRKIKPALSPVHAWEEVQALLPWNPQPTDREALLRAREIEKRYKLSWWDSLIVAAAQLQNCGLLLTEDLQDRAVYGNVTVCNPFRLGVSEVLESYSAMPPMMFSHPRRGRPRVSR